MGKKFAHMFYSFAMSGETRWAKQPSCYPAIVNIVECRIKKTKRYVSSSNLSGCLHRVCSHFARVQEIGREKLSMNEPMWYDVLNCLWEGNGK